MFVKLEFLEHRFTELVTASSSEVFWRKARHLAQDLGAELPLQRLRVLRSYQQHADEHVRGLSAAVKTDGARPEIRMAFLCGVFFGTYHVCDGYAAQMEPVLEQRATALKRVQAEIVRRLAEHGPSHPTTLSRLTQINLSSISRALNALRSAKLVTYDTAQETISDQRHKLYALTDEGHRVAAKLVTEARAPAAEARPVAKVSPPPASTPGLGRRELKPAYPSFRRPSTLVPVALPAKRVPRRRPRHVEADQLGKSMERQRQRQRLGAGGG